jgi:rhamnosyltransferase
MDSKSITVQVLMATYNSIRYLDEQVESTLRQQGVKVNLLCSDDISTDGTFEYLNEKSKQVTNIHILPQQKFGSSGKNFYHLIINADYINNDFIAFSDHDDIWHDDKLLKAIELLKSENCIAYSSSFIAFWNDGRKQYINKAGRNVKFDFIFSSPGPGCTFVIDSKILSQFRNYLMNHPIGYEIVYHDWLIYAWVRSVYPCGWIIDSRSFIFYRQHSSNVIGVNKGYKAIRKRVSLISSNWYSEEIGKILKFLRDTDSFYLITKLFKKSRVGFAFNSFQMRRNKLDSFIMFFLIILNFVEQKKIRLSYKRN